MKIRERGFALITVLIFFLVLLILGVGGAVITQMGYFSIGSEAKYVIAEKRANKALISVLESGICTGNQETGVKVIAIKDSGNNYCFVWSEGRYLGAKVIKTSIFPLKASNWSAAMYRNLNNLSGIGGNSAIVGYDSPENACTDPNSCIAPALITGNLLNPEGLVIACNTNPNNLGSGLISTVTPYVNDETLLQTDLTSKLFNAENRNQLLQNLSENFQVEFENGIPKGLVDPKKELNVNSCTASGNTITCGEGGNADIFTWDPTKKVYIYNKDGREYSRIDFGQNAQITFEDFSGGGFIAGNNISFSQKADVNPTSHLILVARNQITISENNIKISNTFMFSKNYNIDAQNLTIGNGIIYSGGAGVGNLNINVNSGTQLGTSANPILIISDNNINIGRNGNADIWGAIFVTDANNNFNVGYGNGNFKIHGVLISNSLNNNNINLSGNFEIRFNFKVLERLYTNLNQLNLSLMHSPICGASKKKLFITTTMRVY
uniref:Uncharacterized protein n=1 Tax=Thermodesulfobacterium geofontis TaxID=1295609 RepID=A0A7C4NRZ8_9BACT